MYFHRTPSFLFKLFPNILWKGKFKTIYLTFDDGPSKTTDDVLNILNERKIKAIFFCLGHQMSDHPDLISRILSTGHQIGNHSYDHENGWKTPSNAYVVSVDQTQELIDQHISNSGRFFRPPYGKLTFAQWLKLKKKYKIVMWSLMSGDFDLRLSDDDCLQILMNKTRAGDVIVFHDSEKMKKRLNYILPLFLDHCLAKGFKFALI